METKSIVFTAVGKAELLTEDTGVMQEKDVLVRLIRSTISSGTERANVSGEINVSVLDRYTEAHFPRRGGYSAVGEVMEIGPQVQSVKVGDRVVVSWGNHTQYKRMNEKYIHKVESEKISDQTAALALIATFPMAAIRKCRLEIGEPAIVMGQGVLGQLAIQLLHAAGAVPVIAADPVAAKREMALTIGADYALDPNDPDFAAEVKRITHGGAKVAIEVTGFGKALDQVLDCMARMGRVALLGCTRHSDFTIDYYHKVHGPGISLIGAHTRARPDDESSATLWTDHDDIMAILRLAEADRIHLDSLVQETHSPEEAPEIYRRLIEEKSFPVVQFDWRMI